MQEVIPKTFVDLMGNNKFHQLKEWDSYYRGDFGQASLPSTNHSAVAREYDDLLKRADLPICALVVNAVTERLKVDGFRDPQSEDTDERLWSWFQSSKMDGRQQLLYNDALIFGDAFLSITPGGDKPLFRAESPLNMVVKYDPTDPMRVEMAAKQVGTTGGCTPMSSSTRSSTKRRRPLGGSLLGPSNMLVGSALSCVSPIGLIRVGAPCQRSRW